MTEQIVFVYNADSGVFNTLTDIAHKLISPSTYQCDLCSITHGVLTERNAWRTFIESLPLKTVFFHRDEFHAKFDEDDLKLGFPCVLKQKNEKFTLLLSAKEIALCDSVDCLSELIMNKLRA
jgi:hypothetical protein